MKVRRLGLAVAALLLPLVLFPLIPRAYAVNPFNRGSPVGTNLTAVEDFRSEYPFVDFIKQARPWFSGTTTQFQDGRALALDAEGNVSSLLPGQVARTVLFDGLPVDPDLIGRRFVVRFEGQGALTYQLGADLISRAPGRDVIELTGNGPGAPNILVIVLSATTPANPLRHLRVVPEGGICASDPLRRVTASGACAGGDFRAFEDHSGALLFNPEFLDRIKAYRGLRFMDWMRTNNSTQMHFADRPMVAHQFWSTDAGVPLEAMIALANLMAADPWFNIPHRATDGYVTEFATLVRDQLEVSRTVYVEYSNEVWNGQFGQTGFARDQGDALNLGMIDHDGDPTTPEVENATIGLVRFYSRRSRQVHQIFTTVFGGPSRLRRVMATQAVVPFFSQTILEFEGAAASVDSFAIAPYFGDTAASADRAAAYKALGVDGIFEWLTGARAEPRLELNLPRVDQVVAGQLAVVQSFGLPLITYEGGQHFVGAFGFEGDGELNAIFDAVNRDPRMHDVYTTYLTNWRGRSAETFWHFASADRWSRFGRWGALEYQTQPRSEAPKFDAIHDFIEALAGDTTPPAAVTELAAGAVTTSSVALSWTAPGDEANTGRAASYDLRVSASGPITESNWAAATPVSGGPAPLAAGSSENRTVTGLSCGTSYYFALKTADEVPNISSISNSPNGITAACPDSTPPDTTITGGPTGPMTVNGATFTWTGSDNVTPLGSLVYAFRVDPLEATFSAFGAATSKNYTALANGSYTFYVKARDQAGNEDSTPASRSFTVTTSATHTLTVASVNPSSGVGITVSPADNGGLGSGTTPLSRVYDHNALVNLTAPAMAGGNTFQKWQRDGVDVSTSTGVQVTVDANHTLTAVYVVSSFVDVPPNHIFWPWIEALLRAGITGGCGTNPPVFCPDQSVSRAQMAVFLLRGIHGAGYTPPAASGIFADVPPNDPLAAWIEQLFVEGITAGCGTNPQRFCPDQSVTRGQMAVFLLGAKHGAGYQPPAATGIFADVPLAHPFARFIEQLSNEAITGGCGTNPPRYCPDQPVTRAEMAVFLVRAFGLPL